MKRHGLGVVTNAQWIVTVTQLVEAGCRSLSARAETA